MTTIDEPMPRRRFLTRTATVSVGAAALTLIPTIARGRAGANDTDTTAAGIEHIVNGSFEDGPTGSTIPGWTTALPPV